MRNFERKILFALVLIGMSFLPVLVVAMLSLKKVLAEQNTLVDHNVSAMVLAERLRSMHSSQAAAMPLFVLAGDPRVLRSFVETNHDFKKVLGELLSRERDDDDRELLKQIDLVTDALYRQTAPGVRLREEGVPMATLQTYFSQHLGPLHERRERMLDTLLASEAEDLRTAQESVTDTVSRLLWTLGIVSMFALFTVAVMTFLIRKMLAQKTAFDESQRALFEQEARVSQARKEAIEVVAHDLKTPLSSILMSAELLADESGPALDRHEGLQIISRSAESMEKLIKNLLDHAKIEAGQFILEPADTALEPLFLSLLKRFEITARAKGIRLTHEIDDGLPSLTCDAVRLEQVLTNLLGNAFKFTPKDGSVRFKAASDGDSLRIEVSDSGPGIAPGDLPHIFERFWQARATARQGTGLGLSIAKTIVEAHHGDITVESKPGQGSRFTIRLPLNKDSLTGKTATARGQTPPAVERPSAQTSEWPMTLR